MAGNQTRGLGKGLSVLISEEYSKSSGGEAPSGVVIQQIMLTNIVGGKYQPRTRFSEEYLGELADSIRHNGVMQPIVLRRAAGSEQYEIIAGERRWRAAALAGLTEIPAIVRDVNDAQALELALVENIQRQDLSPLEEAAGYQRLMEEFRYTQEQLSKIVGKSRSHIANLLRLLSLPEKIKRYLDDDSISMGHARALLNANDPEGLAEEVVARGLNVRQTEGLVKDAQTPSAPKDTASGNANAAKPSSRTREFSGGNKDPDLLALEETLSQNLGLKVSINDQGHSGEISIRYETLAQLDEILKRLGGNL